MTVVVRSGSASDVGRVRAKNEDLALEASTLFAVADGMGGHAGGEVAARVAVETLREHFDANPTQDGLLDAVEAANAAVWNESQERQDLRGMGTTLTAAAVVTGEGGEDVVALANVGDSRAYVVAEGALVQVTADHSLAEERVRQGVMSEAEAAVHPYRHILTRALGIGPGVDVDLWELRLRPGDRLMLCSDGLTNEVGDDRIAELLAAHEVPSEAARELVAEANRRGGSDNITVVVIDVLGPDGQAPPAGRRPPVVAVPLARPGGGRPAAGSNGATRGAPVAADARLEDATGIVPLARAAPASGEEEPGGIEGQEPLTGMVATTKGAPPGSKREVAKKPRKRRDQPRRLTFRVALFVLLLAGVAVAAYYVVRWYAMDSYYVTLDHGEIVVFQGRPGGLLGFEPKVVDRTGVTANQVLAVRLPALRGDVTEPTLRAAKVYVSNLRQEAISQNLNEQGENQASPGVTTTVPPPTAPTTTVPGAPGTPVPTTAAVPLP